VDLQQHSLPDYPHDPVNLERRGRWTLDDLRYLELLELQYFLGCLEFPEDLLVLEDPYQDRLVLLDPLLIHQFLGYLGILEVPEDQQRLVPLELPELLLQWKK